METLDPTIKDKSARVIDIVARIGKGQRALIVAPPRTGKTVLLQNIAKAIADNHPECYLIVPADRRTARGSHRHAAHGEGRGRLLDLRRTGHPPRPGRRNGDRKGQAPGRAQARRRHPARLDHPPRPRLQHRGAVVGQGADRRCRRQRLQRPKRFFGAARNIEEGGSLTIIATALIDTGSRMDEVIFEEFKGTGNSEIVLDRKVADKRIFPAIDILKSGTRKEELLVEKDKLSKMWVLRRILMQMGTVDAMEFLLDKMKDSKTNEDFFKAKPIR
jgi:transcription termination factor Rho